MSEANVSIGIGGIASVPSNLASGTTDAVDYAEITPDGDAFVCAVTRALARCQSGGIAIVVTTASVPVEADEGHTATTLKGTLTVWNDTDSCALSEPLTVCDFSGEDAVNPEAGTVLRLGSAPLHSTAYEGQVVKLTWNESGDLGTDGEVSPTLGTRPQFILLGWPLQTIEPSRF